MTRLFERGINTSLIMYPGVPVNAARLRFFLTSETTEEEICTALDVTKEVVGPRLKLGTWDRRLAGRAPPDPA